MGGGRVWGSRLGGGGGVLMDVGWVVDDYEAAGQGLCLDGFGVGGGRVGGRKAGGMS